MKKYTFIIIFFCISGTFWSMWLRSEIKNEEVKIKELDKKIDEIEMKTELAEVEWSYITQSKNIELLNNKFLKLEPIPIVDIENYKEKRLLVSNNEN